jgi:tellurite resistance protein TerC
LKLTLTAAHETISTSVPEIPSLVSLGVIVVALTTAIVLSLRYPAPAEDAAEEATAAAPLPDRVG